MKAINSFNGIFRVGNNKQRMFLCNKFPLLLAFVLDLFHYLTAYKAFSNPKYESFDPFDYTSFDKLPSINSGQAEQGASLRAGFCI